MGIRVIIFLMIYRSKIQVGLELPVCTFDFTGKIIIVPSCLFIKISHICSEKIYPAVPVYILRHCYAPLNVNHVLRCFSMVWYIINNIIFGDRRIFLSGSAYTFDDFYITFCSVLLCQGILYLFQFFLETLLELAVH